MKEYRLHPVEDAMAHTLLAQRLQHARSVATEAQRRQVEVDRVIADRTERSVPAMARPSWEPQWARPVHQM